MKIYTIDLCFLGKPETIAAFLIDTGKSLCLVESGPHSTWQNLVQGVEKLGFKIHDIEHVFLTHIHFDHAGAAWALSPKAQIYVHPLGAKHLADPARLYNSAKQIYGDKMETLWGEMNNIAPDKISSVAHGEKIQVQEQIFTAWHTPGHAVHHIAWQLGNVLFCGDVAGVRIGNGIVVPPCPPPDIDLEAWLSSIELMRSLGVKKLYLTHFGEITRLKNHFSQLEKRLIRWANWIEKQFRTGASTAEITPKYQAFVKKELNRFGIVGIQYENYELANPSFMSVAGLVRYWQKKIPNA
jgi:glyoxylase-like metal-dependent hydrolase (beta-lactamase superfamily II)